MSKKSGGFSFGAISALTALLVLALACFSMLSFLTAKNDLALSEKTAQSVTDYYAADLKAQQKAAQAYDICLAGDYAALEQQGFEYSSGIISYTVSINSATGIHVRLIPADGGLECVEWAVISNQEDGE